LSLSVFFSSGNESAVTSVASSHRASNLLATGEDTACAGSRDTENIAAKIPDSAINPAI
jgi:hypothetical protein